MANKIAEANTQLKKLNKFDKNTIRWGIITFLISTILALLPILLGLKPVSVFFELMISVFAITFCTIFVRYSYRIWDGSIANDFIKKEVYTEYLSIYFPQIIYEPEGQITEEEFQKSGLFNLNQVTSFNNGDKFQIQESNQINGIEVTAIEGHGKHAQYIFKGLFISAIHNNNFEGETYIIPSGFINNNFSNFIKNPEITKNEKVILESPVFMKQYDVYTTSQLGARLALTTDIIDSINQLTEQTKLPILFSFIESTVYICVASQDLFKVSNYSIEVESNLKTLNDEMNWLIEFTEKLKLHQTKF